MAARERCRRALLSAVAPRTFVHPHRRRRRADRIAGGERNAHAGSRRACRRVGGSAWQSRKRRCAALDPVRSRLRYRLWPDSPRYSHPTYRQCPGGYSHATARAPSHHRTARHLVGDSAKRGHRLRPRCRWWAASPQRGVHDQWQVLRNHADGARERDRCFHGRQSNRLGSPVSLARLLLSTARRARHARPRVERHLQRTGQEHAALRRALRRSRWKLDVPLPRARPHRSRS